MPSKYPWRSLKTASSERDIPLVGSAYEAAIRIVDVGHKYAFARYCDETKCNANSASAALNKWLKPRIPDGCVIHSFRHSLRDRLRAVECPSDIIDAIRGWTTAGIGHKYGSGYDLAVKHRQMGLIGRSNKFRFVYKSIPATLPTPWYNKLLFQNVNRLETVTWPPVHGPLNLESGARGRIRTTDTRIFSPLLYQLSYPGIMRHKYVPRRKYRAN